MSRWVRANPVFFFFLRLSKLKRACRDVIACAGAIFCHQCIAWLRSSYQHSFCWHSIDLSQRPKSCSVSFHDLKCAFSQLTVSSVVLVAPLSHKVSIQADDAVFINILVFAPIWWTQRAESHYWYALCCWFRWVLCIVWRFYPHPVFCVVVFDIAVLGRHEQAL